MEISFDRDHIIDQLALANAEKTVAVLKLESALTTLAQENEQLRAALVEEGDPSGSSSGTEVGAPHDG